jgi:hypothetical protein
MLGCQALLNVTTSLKLAVTPQSQVNAHRKDIPTIRLIFLWPT